MLIGAIDRINGNILHGWLLGPAKTYPLVLVNDIPATLLNTEIPRPDVCKAYGMKNPVNVGFAAKLPAAPGNARIDLYGITAKGIWRVASSHTEGPICEIGLISQLGIAREISAISESVAIVCQGSNRLSMERAKNLYDIVSTHRPAVIFCYIHEEYGEGIWNTMMNTDTRIVSLPWNLRDICNKFLCQYRVSFNTVWLCGSELLSLDLIQKISNKDTRIILDIAQDDASTQKLSPDIPAEKLVEKRRYSFLLDQISARTVNSALIRSKFGGEIVPHAVCLRSIDFPAKEDGLNIGYIGDITPAKNLVELARAISISRAKTGMPLIFHVYGGMFSDSYRQELEDAGAQVHGEAGINERYEIISRMHVLIAGYPSVSERKSENCYSSNIISEALAVGRPVLVPRCDASQEFSSMEGIFRFDETDFISSLSLALSLNKPIRIPHEFTFESAYNAFARAERAAKPLPSLTAQPSPRMASSTRALVLLWKQSDSGIYGRRVDQIARSFHRHYPERRIYILEFQQEAISPVTKQEPQYLQGESNPEVSFAKDDEEYFSELPLRDKFIKRKSRGYLKNGVYHKTLLHKSDLELREELIGFLADEELRPDNSTFVIFPIIEALEIVEDILRPYTKMADIVDNHLGWAKGETESSRMLAQYIHAIKSASFTLFNSEANMRWFMEHGLVQPGQCAVVPNWYTLPDGVHLQKSLYQDGYAHILYSGNMNDRIDWKLLRRIAELPKIRLHIVGTAEHVREKLLELIEAGAIYHGVTTEEETLELLTHMHGAITAHKLDNISMYMDPIKSRMYKQIKRYLSSD